MITEGKIANKYPEMRFNSGHPMPTCSKCNKLIPKPAQQTLFIYDEFNQKHNFNIFHYINKIYFIYESKRGSAVVYCSEYCRNKHNHRFSGIVK